MRERNLIKQCEDKCSDLRLPVSIGMHNSEYAGSNSGPGGV